MCLSKYDQKNKHKRTHTIETDLCRTYVCDVSELRASCQSRKHYS